MPRLVEYPIDDTVEYILTNSSAGMVVPNDVREALFLLVGCCVRSKTFKIKDMTQLLPGDRRDDTVFDALKIKDDAKEKLDAIDAAIADEVADILARYDAKAKNVQVVANNIRLGKIKIQKVQDSADTDEAAEDTAIGDADEHNGTDTDAVANVTADDSPYVNKENEQQSDAKDEGTVKPDDTNDDKGTSDVIDVPDDEPKHPDFEAMLHDDVFSADFDDDDDDSDAPIDIDVDAPLTAIGGDIKGDDKDENEFDDDDGDDVNGYVDEDSPIDIDTDAYRSSHSSMISDAGDDKQTDAGVEYHEPTVDTAKPVDIDGILATDRNDDDRIHVEGDEENEEPSIVKEPADTHNGADNPVDGHVSANSGIDEHTNEEKQPDNDIETAVETMNEQQIDDNGAVHVTTQAATNGQVPLASDISQIPVAAEVADLHKRIANVTDPKQVQAEFEKLSPDARQALADFAAEKAKEANEKKDAPDTTGGLPEFARELEAEKKAAAEAELNDDADEDIDDVQPDMESGIGDPDIINPIIEDIDEPDFVLDDEKTDFSETNPIVSGMLDKMYDGHGINGKSACVLLSTVFLVLTMIPFAGILNKFICGIDSLAFIGDQLFALKAIGILSLLFIITRFVSLTGQARAYRKNYNDLDNKAERTAYRFYEPSIRAEFMFPSRSLGESAGRSITSAVAGLALAAAASFCTIDAPIAGMAIMAVSIVSLIALGCHPLIDPEAGTDKCDMSDETELYIEEAIRANKRKDCWMLAILFLSFMTCVSLGNSIGLTVAPISMFFSPTLSVTIPGFTAFGIAGVLAIAHAFMATIGMGKRPLSIFWTLIKSAVVLFAGLGIGTLLTINALASMTGLILIAIVSVSFYLGATSSDYKADLPIKRR